MATSTTPNGYSQQTDPSTSQQQQQDEKQQQTGAASTQSPDQVGWIFVESYYTTLNKHPEELALYYNKRSSSSVWGLEGETVPLVTGRTEIAKKIDELSFNNCKVRVTNVDSQRSIGNGIIIQVMGQISNNDEASRRFVQTFFLAEQPGGFYVHNDIFRYLKEEEEEGEYGNTEVVQDEAPQEEATAEQALEEIPAEENVQEVKEPIDEPEPEPEPAHEPEPEPQPEPEILAPKAEERIPIEPAVPDIVPAVPTTNGASVVELESDAKTEEAPEPVSLFTKPESAVSTPAQPTPVATPPPQSTSKEISAPILTPAPAAAAAAPTIAPVAQPIKKTWAGLVASSTGSSTPPLTPPAIPAATVPQPALTQAPTSTSVSSKPSGGWQTAVDNSRRHSRPQSISASGINQTQAYIKNVNENVDINQLKEQLQKYGNLKYFEAEVSRNFALAEFETPTALQAAKAANPIRVGDFTVVVEERHGGGQRINRPGGYGPSRSPVGSQRGDLRGGPQARGNYQRSDGSRYEGRGGSRGRGSKDNYIPRGRGASTNASS